MKSEALLLIPGILSFIYTYLARIYSLISYLFFPLYGRLPINNSYIITPRA